MNQRHPGNPDGARLCAYCTSPAVVLARSTLDGRFLHQRALCPRHQDDYRREIRLLDERLRATLVVDETPIAR